jgi:hypothetical protein
MLGKVNPQQISVFELHKSIVEYVPTLIVFVPFESYQPTHQTYSRAADPLQLAIVFIRFESAVMQQTGSRVRIRF